MEKFTDSTNRTILFVVPILILLFVLPFSLIAGDEQNSTGTDSLMSIYSNRTFSFEFTMFLGFGTKNLTVAKTTDNEDVTMSGGGGIGGILSAYYNINPSLEAGISYGTQSSSLSKKVDNAEGNFDRSQLLMTAKYGIPLSASGILKLGGGLGYYMSGNLDMDFSKVTSGAHNVYTYDNSIGFHIVVDYVMPISASFSWGAGLRYYNVSYDLKTAKSNGTSIPLNILPASIKDDIGKLDGSGFDFSIFIAYNLH
jgi:hypothetical protein